MSELKKQLQEDMKSAMKEKNKQKLDVVRGVIAEIKKTEIDSKKELDDAAVIALVQKEVKKRRDAIEFAEKGDRQDMVEANKQEIEILQTYLGAQLSEDELKGLIQGLIDGGANNIGAIMGALNKDHKGQFEGKLASTMIKEMLG